MYVQCIWYYVCAMWSNPGFQRFKQALGFNTKSSMDLKNEVKRLMFSSDREPVVVSNDDARFIMVMSAFTAYEKQVHTVYSIQCTLYTVLCSLIPLFQHTREKRGSLGYTCKVPRSLERVVPLSAQVCTPIAFVL